MIHLRSAFAALALVAVTAAAAQAQTRTGSTAPQGTVATGSTGGIAVLTIASTANTVNTAVTASGVNPQSVGSAEFLVTNAKSPVANQTVSLSIASSVPGICSLSTTSAVTNASGLVSVKVSGNGKAGTCTLTAKVNTASTTVNYSIK